MKKAVIALAGMLMLGNVDAKAIDPVKENSESLVQEASVKEVVDKYIKASGGLDKIKGIKNMELVMETEIQGMKLIIKSVTDQENNRLLNLTEMNGNQVAKTVIKDSKGKMISMGQEKELTEDQLNSMRSQTFVFPELFYEELGYTVTYGGLQEVEGVSAHKLILKDANGMQTNDFYDAESGLKIMTESDVAGKINFKDYKEMDGITVPTKMIISNAMMPMPMEATVTSIVFNQELDDSLFE
ncbi:outer membrane lipoprotein-sorting protein [Echinicola sp. 20G]|uniref:outer membrane lipoprotein-sorting protein n=1 Tax=Echinicola sp. 20G TaxID=2781961 RepID=UPI001F3B38F0|nr:outer membrane lipoprotein-sorting protein [Echinicola sp. 20G]